MDKVRLMRSTDSNRIVNIYIEEGVYFGTPSFLCPKHKNAFLIAPHAHSIAEFKSQMQPSVAFT